MRPLLRLRSWWRRQVAERLRRASARRSGRRSRWREARALQSLGPARAHVQSRYGLLKSREEAF
jgi:hypothetical protein